jgi:PadR family transcriptional regulator PadR
MGMQVGGAILDACVLAMLSREDAYGYSLTQSVKDTLDVSESTLYPVMRRLQTQGELSTYDLPHAGRNRRYYRITETGLLKLQEHIDEWREYKERIDSILGGEGA